MNHLYLQFLRHTVSLVLTIFFFCFFFIRPTHAAIADRFFYPLESWVIAVEDREHLGGGVYHAGIDAGVELSAGAPVYAIAAGEVQEAQKRSLFGEVILIEHELETGERVVSLYGHLWPKKSLVKPGDRVKAGQQIGVLGNTKNNGGWVVHLHFGIHKKPYTGEWVYWGHLTDKSLLKEWYNTETFLSKRAAKLPSPTVTVPQHVLALQGVNNNQVLRLYNANGRIRQTLHLTRAQENRLTDVEVSDIDLNGKPNIIGVATTKKKKTVVMIFSRKGRLQSTFPVFAKAGRGGSRIAVGDVDGDGIDEVVVSTGRDMTDRVKVFEANGELVSVLRPFSMNESRGGLNIATGDVNGDGADEIIVSKRRGQSLVKILTVHGVARDTFRVYEKTYRAGVNIAAGDVDGDGMDEVIAAPNGKRSGEVFVYERRLRRLDAFDRKTPISYIPFPHMRDAAIDVSVVDWEDDGVAEIQMSLLNGTQGQIKTVRYNEKKRVLYDKPLRLKNFSNGARIAGWEK